MGTRKRANGGDPRKHTAIIGDVETMWQKLVWDIHQFDQIQRSNPDLREPLGFAAINVCIAAASLADWAVSSVVSRRREEGQPTTDAAVRAHIHAHVHQQAMYEAIANTAKHARLQDGLWPDGEVRIDWNDASEDDPPGFILRHVHPGGIQSIALNAFGVLQRNWWGELQNLGFPFSGNISGFEWWQRDIEAIFGRRE
jgi:hypothetical protein